MKKLSSIGAVAFAALIAAIAMLGFSSPAQAYPDLRFDLTVNRSVLYGGESFTATASSQGATCAWTLEWNGVVRLGGSSTGQDFVTAYQAPKVTKVTKIPLHGTCAYSARTAPASSARAAATWERTIMITVLPRSTAVSPPVGSDLPNTGGPNLLFLLGGIALLVSGATAVTVARRRAEEAEIQASGA
ncbi:LPXTG cell wall anchor domain-containing protein [Nocardioides pocheonensis]|nr:LPXTG cell wall anchor domain-containing protein [Nocardioides pocheonensis]